MGKKDILTPVGIGAYLADKGLGGQIHVHDSLHSTSVTAKELAKSGQAGHGTVVIADGQTGGRGRFDRVFYSPAGCGLYMSLVLAADKLWREGLTLVTVYAAVAVSEATFAVTGQEARIKWVNDVFVAGKKVCGILTEGVSIQGDGIKWVVVGIGVNCHEPAGGYPAGIRHTAGDIHLAAAGRTRAELASALIERMVQDTYPAPSSFIPRYRERLLHLNERVLVDGLYRARVRGVDELGRLLVEKDDGSRHALVAGEITI